VKVLITGAAGFLGENLRVFLSEQSGIDILLYTKKEKIELLASLVEQADFIFHLAGVNRPKTDEEFKVGNTNLTKKVCELVESTGRAIPILYTSSIQAESDTEYGKSKLAAEHELEVYAKRTGNTVQIYRLQNVFGKWCKPNYNSVVATFCHNIAHKLPISVNDPEKVLKLVYVDDVIISFANLITAKSDSEVTYHEIAPLYEIKLADLADQLYAFEASRNNLRTERVGTGLVRALYSTYLSYIPQADFSYPIKQYSDERGTFVEMLKTIDSGQFSYFTAHPGITRGGHYHHTKTEKFLVIKGQARFKFCNVMSGERYEYSVSGQEPEIVESIPGWAHDVTNIGDGELFVLLWANEAFDIEAPDTYMKDL